MGRSKEGDCGGCRITSELSRLSSLRTDKDVEGHDARCYLCFPNIPPYTGSFNLMESVSISNQYRVAVSLTVLAVVQENLFSLFDDFTVAYLTDS